MSFLRPEITETLTRWREVIAAAALAALGAWGLSQDGWVVPLAGLALLVVGAGWGVLAVRSVRFHQAGEAPGIVRVTEAQVAYLGPRVGGFLGLPDLIEIRLLSLRGRRVWKLVSATGEVLHIPVEAAGADALFDAFAGLPGMDSAALVAALGGETPSASRVIALDGADRLIWARKAAGVVVR